MFSVLNQEMHEMRMNMYTKNSLLIHSVYILLWASHEQVL